MINDTHFWLVLGLCIVIYLLYRPLKKAIGGALDQKINKIKSDIVQSDKLRKEAEDLLKEMQEKYNNISSLKGDIIHEAKMKYHQIMEANTEQMNVKLKVKSQEMLNDLKYQKTQILNDCQLEIANIVNQIILEYFKNSDISDIAIFKHQVSKKMDIK
ncbi:MAG: hypothetical protein AB8B67_02925 [Rickettsiaceae bacterium]